MHVVGGDGSEKSSQSDVIHSERKRQKWPRGNLINLKRSSVYFSPVKRRPPTQIGTELGAIRGEVLRDKLTYGFIWRVSWSSLYQPSGYCTNNLACYLPVGN